MVEVKVSGDRAVFEVEGLHKLWSLRSRLEIPLEHIRGVRADPAPAMGWFDGLKVAGTGLPHLFRAGTFYQQGDFVFWDVRRPEKAVVVELEDEHFSKLIVEVEDPAATVSLLEGALSKQRA
jgi:hypothetical protein